MSEDCVPNKCYVVGKALLICGHMGLNRCGVPWSAMVRWKQKSWSEMNIHSQKLTDCRPKPNGFQNNNDNTNKTRESTGKVNCCDYWCGWYQQAPNWNMFWKQMVISKGQAAQPPPLPESFHDDVMCWDPTFHVKKVGLQNRRCNWLSWSDTNVESVGVVLNSLLWTK